MYEAEHAAHKLTEDSIIKEPFKLKNYNVNVILIWTSITPYFFNFWIGNLKHALK